MITSSNEANEARPDRQNNDIPACSKPTVYSLVYFRHRTYVLYFYIPSPLLIEHSSIFPVFVLCTILLYSLRYWVGKKAVTRPRVWQCETIRMELYYRHPGKPSDGGVGPVAYRNCTVVYFTA